MLTYTIDLYAADLSQNPNAVCTQTAQIDSSGYYAQTRVDPDNHNFPKERQLDFFGGLRWRFDQYVPNFKYARTGVEPRSHHEASSALLLLQDIFNVRVDPATRYLTHQAQELRCVRLVSMVRVS